MTDEQFTQLELAVGQRIGQVRNLPIDFTDTRPYGPQCVAAAAQVGFTPQEWATLPIIVNPPGFAPGAAALLSELHGRLGYFPAVVRLRPVASSTPRLYEFAEIINLQALRDAARERGKQRL